MKKHQVILLVLVLCFCTGYAVTGVNGVASQVASTKQLIDDRIRNTFAVDANQQIFSTTFGLEAWVDDIDHHLRPPEPKAGSIIRFRIKNNEFDWQFEPGSVYIIRLDSQVFNDLDNSNSDNEVNTNCYNQDDIDKINNIDYPTNLPGYTGNPIVTQGYLRYRSGSGCWASPVLMSSGTEVDNRLLVLTKSGCLLLLKTDFTNNMATVIWKKDLRHGSFDNVHSQQCEDPSNATSESQFEFIATPTVFSDGYIYVAGIKCVFKIDPIDGNILNFTRLSISTEDYLASAISFDTNSVTNFYLVSKMGNVFAFDSSLTLLYNYQLSPEFSYYSSPLIDSDGQIYISGGNDNNSCLYRSDQRLRLINQYQGLIFTQLRNTGDNPEIEPSNVGPFTSSILTDSSKNLYCVDNEKLHFIRDYYDLNLVPLNQPNINPLTYARPQQPAGEPNLQIFTEIQIGKNFPGNHSLLIERADINKSIYLAVNNTSSSLFLYDRNNYYPDTSGEYNINGCIQFSYNCFNYGLIKMPSPVNVNQNGTNCTQTWGGVAPYIANSQYYNMALGDERGGVWSYPLCLPNKAMLFPEKINGGGVNGIIPSTGYHKYMKGLNNICQYNVVPQLWVDIPYQAEAPSLNIYTNSYYRQTEPSYYMTQHNVPVLRVIFTNLLNHPRYTISFRNRLGDIVQYDNIGIAQGNGHIYVNPYPVLDVNAALCGQNDYYVISWPENLPLNFEKIIVRNGFKLILDANANIRTHDLVMEHNSKLELRDGSVFRPYEVDCEYAIGDDGLWIEFSTIGNNTGRMIVEGNLTAQNHVLENGTIDLGCRVLFKGYASTMNDYNYNIAYILGKEQSTIKYQAQNHHTNTPCHIGSYLNKGITIVNDKVEVKNLFYNAYNDVLPLSTGKVLICQASPVNEGNLIFSDCYFEIYGGLKIGYFGMLNSSNACLTIQDFSAGSFCFSNIALSKNNVYGKLSILGSSKCFVLNNSKLVFHQRSVLDLNGGNIDSSEGAELAAKRTTNEGPGGVIIFVSGTTNDNGCHIQGYKYTGAFSGDLVRTDEFSRIVSCEEIASSEQEMNDIQETQSFNFLDISSTNTGNRRWRGISIRWQRPDLDYEFNHCHISSIDTLYVKCHSQLKFTYSAVDNCTYGAYASLFPGNQDNQNKFLNIQSCTFTRNTYSVFVNDNDSVHGPDLTTAITGCSFGNSDYYASANGYGIALNNCTNAIINGCNFISNQTGINATNSWIGVGAHFIPQNLVDPIIDPPCNFFNNSSVGIMLIKSDYHHPKSIVYGDNFYGGDNSGTGIFVHDAQLDVRNNKFSHIADNHNLYLQGHGFFGRDMSCSIHGFTSNIFDNNGGSEIIADEVTMGWLYNPFGHGYANQIIDIDHQNNGPSLPAKFNPLGDYDLWDYFVLSRLPHGEGCNYEDGEIIRPVNVSGNDIFPNQYDPTAQDRFYPNASAFLPFSISTSPLRIMMQDGITQFYQEQYDLAKSTMKCIIGLYPDSLLTTYAIDYLYIAERCSTKDYEALMAYLDLKIPSDTLVTHFKKEEIRTKCQIKQGQYLNAIQTLDLLINNPDSKTDSLLAVIDEAYCYMCLNQSGSKALPNCRFRTPTYESYLNLLLNLNVAKPQNNTDDTIPKTLVLKDNYPNPFYPETTICYSLPKSGRVILSIYNVKGQLVKKLVDEAKIAGNYKIIWNGKNDLGREVSSGVYFTKVEQAGKIKVRKMMLLK